MTTQQVQYPHRSTPVGHAGDAGLSAAGDGLAMVGARDDDTSKIRCRLHRSKLKEDENHCRWGCRSRRVGHVRDDRILDLLDVLER